MSRLQVRCRQPAAQLDVPIAGPVGVRLRIGDAAEYCLEFDGQAPGGGGKSAARWQARDAVAPLQCPEISPVFLDTNFEPGVPLGLRHAESACT